MRLHHVQVSMPSGGQDEARRFYAEALGMVEVDKPAGLAGRGGCWFRVLDGGAVTAEIHLGPEDPFVPQQRAHPALLQESVTELERVGERIAAAGYEVSWVERDSFDGYLRFHARDGFGNRIEVLAARE